MPEDRNFTELNKRVGSIEKALETIPAIGKRVDTIEKSLETIASIEKRVKVIEDFGTRLNQVSIGIDAVAKKMESIDKSLEVLPAFDKRVKAVEEQLQKKPQPETDFDRLQRDNFELKRNLAVEQLKVQNLSADYTKLQEANSKLLEQLEFVSKSMTSIKFDALTSQFRDAIRIFNQQVETDKTQPYFIDNLDIELKTGLQFGNELKLLQAVPDKSSPANLSTIKFSLKPKTNLKITD